MPWRTSAPRDGSGLVARKRSAVQKRHGLVRPARYPQGEGRRAQIGARGNPRASEHAEVRNEHYFGADDAEDRTERVPPVEASEHIPEYSAARLRDTADQDGERRAHRGGGQNHDGERRTETDRGDEPRGVPERADHRKQERPD